MKKKIFAIVMMMMVVTVVGCGKEDKKVDLGHDPKTENSVEATVESNSESVGETTVTEEASNTVDMTIEEYISYIHSKSTDTVKEFIFGVQTPNDTEHVCSNTYDIQLTNDGICAVDIRNMAYSFAGVLSDENMWFMPPTFALNSDGLLDETAKWDNLSFEYDSAIDSVMMKAADGTILAYFGEASIVNEYIIFTTHLDDGDYVVYVNTNYDRVSYSTTDVDGKTINFVTHH